LVPLDVVEFEVVGEEHLHLVMNCCKKVIVGANGVAWVGCRLMTADLCYGS